jgi:uncharacterized protein (DUF2252 family)
VQACGDAHLLNFGLFATPERNLSFGLNDFDETLPAPVVAERLERAEHHTNLDALPKLTEPAAGGRRFVEDPPLLTHVEECHEGWVTEVPARYRATLSDERRRLLSRFRAQDAARKVVGVGSVGTRCYVVLLLGDRHDDPLLLQVKQAAASVLEPHAGRSRYRHPGHRVVDGQRLLQTASDIFLGWTADGDAHFYVRQLWDMKGSVNLETLDPADLAPYGRLCGWVLARAHARSSDAAAIGGYLGSGDQFDRAVGTFAEAYADQTEADWAAFSRARGSAPGDGGRGAGTNQRKGAEG